MSFLSRLFGRPPKPASVVLSPPAAAPESPVPWQSLEKCGATDGPSEAQALELIRLAQAQGQEQHVIAILLRACANLPVSEALRIRLAEILGGRRDYSPAISVLSACSSTAALVLLSDLHYETGNQPKAVATIERVLAREIDAPGAKERHQRWQPQRLAPCSKARDTTLAVPVPGRSPYRILREAARGGCGTIYEAFDDSLMRAVAYKVYHRPKQDREQLLRECTIAVRFAGPWTVGIYDADPEQGWIALEWVAGGSIRDCLVNKRFDTLRPLRVWARALAQALASVHSKGYVHADLKPANILLRDSHTPILTDFGIAAEQGTAPKGGSRGYLSPERLAGAALTPSDDVYAFGRVLEDVWQQTGQAPSTVYLDLIASCLSSKSERPKDGAELVTRLEQSGAD